MKITIPFKTPTINHLYGFKGYHKFLTKEAKKLRKDILDIISSEVLNIIRKKDIGFDLEYPWKANKLDVTVTIYENWYTKKGEVKKKDIANREKFLIDSIFRALDIDDKIIFKHKMIKKQSLTQEKAVITIKPIKTK